MKNNNRSIKITIILNAMNGIYRKKSNSILIGMQTNRPKHLDNSNKW
jgi:hypothetical protein